MEERPSTSSPRGRFLSYLAGLWYPFKAMWLIGTSLNLLLVSVLPLITNIILFVGGFFLARQVWGHALSFIRPDDTVWYLTILLWATYVVAWSLGLVLYLVMSAMLFTFVGKLLAAPFLDILSEKAEESLRGLKDETPFSLKLLLCDLKNTVFEEARKFILWLTFLTCSLPLLLIPILGKILYLIVNTVFTVYFLGAAFVDIPLARRRLAPKLKREFAWRNRWCIAGLGTAIYATFLIPFTGFVLLPVSTVAGTWLFCDRALPEELHRG